MCSYSITIIIIVPMIILPKQYMFVTSTERCFIMHFLGASESIFNGELVRWSHPPPCPRYPDLPPPGPWLCFLSVSWHGHDGQCCGQSHVSPCAWSCHAATSWSRGPAGRITTRTNSDNLFNIHYSECVTLCPQQTCSCKHHINFY